MTLRVGIVMGSDSDLPHMEGCMQVLRELQIPFEVRVLSAHRTPDEAQAFARGARENGFGALVAAAGGAAHLAGALAAASLLPVIGVPIASSTLLGLDALLSTVQMPPGVPVATVAVGPMGARNAAWLAARMLALADPGVATRLQGKVKEMAEAVRKKDRDVRERFARESPE